MSNDILKPTQIDEISFPGLETSSSYSGSSSTKDTLLQSEIGDQKFTTPTIANSLISDVLDTQRRQILSNFSFSRYGSIEIGNYSTAAGVRISPNGIVGGVAGVPKFTLNALTGDAYFNGTLGASVIYTTALVVGTNVGIGTAFPTASAGDLAYEDLVEKAKLGTTIISGGYIKTDLLTASNILTGTLTGITVQSGVGDERIILSSGNYIYFYAGGNLKCQLRGTTAGSGGLSMTGDLVLQNNKSILIASSSGGGSEYGGISITSGNQLWLTCGTGNTFYLENNAQTEDLINIGSGGMIYCKSNQIQLNNKKITLSDNDVSFWHDSSSGRDRNVITWGDGSIIGFDRTGSWIHINGNDKTAIMATSKGFNALYCAEAPEVWFFDFCDTKKKIDPLFLEVTEGEMRFIKCDNGFQVWRRRRGHANKRFEAKTALQFYKNEAFLKMAK